MKKVGLMTWFTYDNFGSLLQCKATMKVVEKLNYQIELINYLPKKNYSKPSSKINILKKIIKGIIKNKSIEIKNMNMNLFREKLKKSKMVRTKSELYLLNNEYDTFICGSDQIWAPTVYDENYFLAFVRDEGKKIAYAPSIGLPEISDSHVRENMKNLISKFKYLSIREEQGAKIIEELTDKKAKIVLDPTLLLSKNEWKEEFVKLGYDNYILGYFLGKNRKYYKVCQKIAKKLNKKLLILPTSNSDLYKKECLKDDLGPREFLSLINSADLILTDSFHGTIFSINFEKPVIAFKRFKDNRSSQNSRIYNILNKLELNDILFEENINFSIQRARNIDYEKVKNKLESLKKESLSYLETSLKKSTNSIMEEPNIEITNNCTGCGVCAVVCPKNCIKIEENKYGFYSYKIHHEKCIKCMQCIKVCGEANILTSQKEIKDLELYSGYATDKNILKESTSGGICSLIALNEIEKNGQVIGCKYDNKFNRVISGVAKSEEEFIEFKGSKYLQAYTYNAYKEIKNIDKGVIIGTPCQIGSLDLYLKKLGKRDSFILIDFICHGVPSYILWDKYIKKFKNLEKINFRDKKYGWRSMVLSIKSRDNYYHNSEEKDEFYHFFTIGNIYNFACYECKYRNKTVADIRVGDYWGPKFKNNSTGVSMIITNTVKGKEIIKELVNKNKLIVSEEDINDYYKYQQTENKRIPLEHSSIIKMLKDKNISLEEVDKKYNKLILNRRKLQKLKSKILSL